LGLPLALGTDRSVEHLAVALLMPPDEVARWRYRPLCTRAAALSVC
jgi:hypothetical protein